MVYVTVRSSLHYDKMTVEDLLFGSDDFAPRARGNTSNTRTYCYRELFRSSKLYSSVDSKIRKLREFNEKYPHLYDTPKEQLYRTFHIPKRSGGLRRIDAPNGDLMACLRELKELFESFGVLYHTSAFAYIHGRSTIDAVKRHQTNESKWFAKFDLSNFFGSTTPDFVWRMLSEVFPFSEIIKRPDGEIELRKALSLGVLNDGLPQGTPLSPTLTNIMMIPVDFQLSKRLREKNLCYTRYADDFLVSSKYNFDYHEVENIIIDVLREFGAPFSLNREKTRYGSSAGSNWNLGVMLNKDNQITVGYKAKKRFQSMLFNYAKDKRSGRRWDLHDVMTMEGLRSYYYMVEGETINRIIEHVSRKTGGDIAMMMKSDLKCENAGFMPYLPF